MKRKWYLIPMALFLACVVFAGIIRLSYTDSVKNEISSYLYLPGTEKSWETVFKEANVQNTSDLVKQADLIAQVQFNGERLVRDNGLYSTVHVQKIYKGDIQREGQDIILTESMSVFQKTKFLNCSMPMWIPLQKGSEYLVLLEKIPFNKARKLNDFQQRQYYPITNSPAGCFLLGSAKKTSLSSFKDVKNPNLKTLAGKSLYPTNQQQIDGYYQIKKQVFQKLKITET